MVFFYRLRKWEKELKTNAVSASEPIHAIVDGIVARESPQDDFLRDWCLVQNQRVHANRRRYPPSVIRCDLKHFLYQGHNFKMTLVV